jgi:hypothetical protein
MLMNMNEKNKIKKLVVVTWPHEQLKAGTLP